MAEEETESFGEQEQELYEHYRFIVDPGQSMLRIDKYLSSRIENVSRTRVQAAAQAGNILVNDSPVKPNYRVKPLDVIQILLPNPPREIELIPQDIPIKIVYEDDDLVVVDKAAGMVVHPAYGNYSGMSNIGQLLCQVKSLTSDILKLINNNILVGKGGNALFFEFFHWN